MIRRFSALTVNGRCLPSLSSSRSRSSDGSGGTGATGGPRCATSSPSRASSTSPAGAAASGSLATAPTNARTTTSGQRLTRRDSSVRPGMKWATKPTIGRSAEQKVWQWTSTDTGGALGMGATGGGAASGEAVAPLPWPPSAASPRAPAPPRRRSRRRSIVSGHQLVAGAVDGHDVARLGGVLFDLLAQLHHEVVDAAGAGVPRHAPDLLQDLLAGDRLARPFPEEAQELHLVKRQRAHLPLAR